MSDPEYIKRFAKALYPDSTELCMSVATEESMLTDAADKIGRLQARAEEVEKYNTEMARVLSEGHHITDEQIDAAWDQRVYIEGRDKPMIPADKIGIKRCDICEQGEQCEKCNGYGWVKDAV